MALDSELDDLQRQLGALAGPTSAPALSGTRTYDSFMVPSGSIRKTPYDNVNRSEWADQVYDTADPSPRPQSSSSFSSVRASRIYEAPDTLQELYSSPKEDAEPIYAQPGTGNTMAVVPKPPAYMCFKCKTPIIGEV